MGDHSSLLRWNDRGKVFPNVLLGHEIILFIFEVRRNSFEIWVDNLVAMYLIDPQVCLRIGDCISSRCLGSIQDFIQDARAGVSLLGLKWEFSAGGCIRKDHVCCSVPSQSGEEKRSCPKQYMYNSFLRPIHNK